MDDTRFDFEDAVESDLKARALASAPAESFGQVKSEVVSTSHADGLINIKSERSLISGGVSLRPSKQFADSKTGGSHAITRHVLVCRHWLKGTCAKGEDCDFLHAFDLSKMPLCHQYRNFNRCQEREQGLCFLRHDDDAPDDDAGYSSGPEGKQLPGKTAICLKYFFGYCPLGVKCTLLHISLPSSKRPVEMLPDWYLYAILSEPGQKVIPKVDPASRVSMRDLDLKAQKWISEIISQKKSTTQSQRAPSVEATGSIPREVGPPLGSATTEQPKPSANIITLSDILPDTRRVFCLVPPPLRAEIGQESGCIRVRTFVIKSAKIENVLVSVQRGVWATGKHNIPRLQDALRTCHHVILLFSANESGGFQGIARMASMPTPGLYPTLWGSFSLRLSHNFRVHWLKFCSVEFESVSYFSNYWNENRPIKNSRDGQELPMDLADALTSRLLDSPDIDLLGGTHLEMAPRIDHSTFFYLSPQQQQELEISKGLRTREEVYSPSAHQTDYQMSRTAVQLKEEEDRKQKIQRGDVSMRPNVSSHQQQRQFVSNQSFFQPFSQTGPGHVNIMSGRPPGFIPPAPPAPSSGPFSRFPHPQRSFSQSRSTRTDFGRGDSSFSYNSSEIHHRDARSLSVQRDEQNNIYNNY